MAMNRLRKLFVWFRNRGAAQRAKRIYRKIWEYNVCDNVCKSVQAQPAPEAPKFDALIAEGLVRTVDAYERNPSYDGLRFVADALMTEVSGARLDDKKYLDVRKVCGRLSRLVLPGYYLAEKMLAQIVLHRAIEKTAENTHNHGT